MLIYLLIFIFGSIIGSFLNVVICRLPEKRSIIRGRSSCPHCKETIKAYDLIPIISFLFLRGKCRKCKVNISWQYPVVELVTGLLFLLVGIYYNAAGNLNNAFMCRDLVFTAALVVIFVTDLRYFLIYDAVTVPMMFFAVIMNLVLTSTPENFVIVLSYLALAGLVGGGFFYLQYYFSRGAWVGVGDICLGMLMGFMLGWPNVLVALLIAYISGAVISVFLLLVRKKTMKSQVQFGAFLTAATFIVLLYGEKIINWYMSLFYRV